MVPMSQWPRNCSQKMPVSYQSSHHSGSPIIPLVRTPYAGSSSSRSFATHSAIASSVSPTSPRTSSLKQQHKRRSRNPNPYQSSSNPSPNSRSSSPNPNNLRSSNPNLSFFVYLFIFWGLGQIQIQKKKRRQST